VGPEPISVTKPLWLWLAGSGSQREQEAAQVIVQGLQVGGASTKPLQALGQFGQSVRQELLGGSTAFKLCVHARKRKPILQVTVRQQSSSKRQEVENFEERPGSSARICRRVTKVHQSGNKRQRQPGDTYSNYNKIYTIKYGILSR
jgi:hypothetical protein